MADDFKRSNIGDKRLDARVVSIARALAVKPEKSFPAVFGDEQELRNAYNFFGHDWVSFEDVLQPHLEATAERCEVFGQDFSVVHDTTEFSFPLHDGRLRKNLARPSNSRQGFFGHGSLAVIPGDTACPLGYLDYYPFVHSNDIPDQQTRSFWQQRGGVMDYEPARWMRGIDRADRRIDNTPLHIIDSEGDIYGLIDDLQQKQHRYLIRLGQNRRVVGADGTSGLLHEVMGQSPVVTTREVQVSEQRPSGPPRSRNPARRSRRATLQVRASTLDIVRPDSVDEDRPARIRTNVVHLVEPSPPEGEEPIEWYLATSEPVGTADAAEAVASRYEDRWLIEEANKAVKTGCNYRKRRLDSATSLLNALAVSLPVSLDLLRFRYLSRTVPDWPANTVVTDQQLDILKTVVDKVDFSEEPTVGEATDAVAKLGGFLQHNKVAGWQVLSRGYQTLLEYEVGWKAAHQSDKGP